MPRPLTASRFLRIHHDQARAQPHAIADVIGDGILLAGSPFYRRVRDHVCAAGVRFAAQPSPRVLIPLDRPPMTRLEYIPNLKAWRDTVAARDVSASTLLGVVPRNAVLRTTATWLARATLSATGKRAKLPPALAFALTEAFGDVVELLTALFPIGAEAQRVALAMNCGAEVDFVPLVAPFRVLENQIGSELAIASLLASGAHAYASAPPPTLEEFQALLAMFEATPRDRELGANLLVAIRDLRAPVALQQELFALRRARAGIHGPTGRRAGLFGRGACAEGRAAARTLARSLLPVAVTHVIPR